MRKFFVCFISFICLALVTVAQTPTDVTNQNPGAMETNGKIYVVMAVCLVILTGLIGYLFVLDRRISKMEHKKD